jgi:hypothetical protein
MKFIRELNAVFFLVLKLYVSVAIDLLSWVNDMVTEFTYCISFELCGKDRH